MTVPSCVASVRTSSTSTGASVTGTLALSASMVHVPHCVHAYAVPCVRSQSTCKYGLPVGCTTNQCSSESSTATPTAFSNDTGAAVVQSAAGPEMRVTLEPAGARSTSG